MHLGVGKFVFGDNSTPKEEKLKDVLQDYIKGGIVDILDIIGNPIAQGTFFGVMYEKYKTKCEWLTFFDFDEYLEMHFEEGKNLLLKEYLSNPIFKNCDAIVFNWLMYTDNNLVYYDNRKLVERFIEPLYSTDANRYVKSIVRGNLTITAFIPGKTNHSPQGVDKKYDSTGEPVNVIDSIYSPHLKYAYFKHYSRKTAEEYVNQVLKGFPGYNKLLFS